MSTEDKRCSCATWQETSVNRGGQTEARNRVAPFEHFLSNFQRQTSQITETKITLTPRRPIRKPLLQHSSEGVISHVLSH